jgi:hypothetical protein
MPCACQIAELYIIGKGRPLPLVPAETQHSQMLYAKDVDGSGQASTVLCKTKGEVGAVSALLRT